MTRRSSAIVLWIALIFCLPYPFFLVETGHQPLAAIMQLLGYVVALLTVEGFGGVADLMVLILGTQILVGLGVLTVLARIFVALAFSLLETRGAVLVVALVAVLFSTSLAQPIYRTPFRTAGLHATLAQVFE